jgi:RNA polymerase sigma factor (sigma-70 family)
MSHALSDASLRRDPAPPGDGSDRQLLTRFVAHRDEDAFAELVRRHGGTVWRVCRRVLHQEADAEDAFQAVLLLLARKAASIRKGEAVGSWLYGVAYRTALKARQAAIRRQKREARAASPAPPQPPWGEAALRELQRILDEEVQRLADKYRAPFILCCLEGLGRAEAAQELGWKEGTLASRLAQARALLHKRLARRGITLTAALTAVALVQGSASAAPAALLQAAAQGALAGKSMAGLSPAAIALADTVLPTLAMAHGKTALALVLALPLVLTSAGVTAFPAVAGLFAQQAPPAQANAMELPAEPSDVWSVAVSPDGKLLAAGAGWWDRPGEVGVWDLATRQPLRRFAEDRGVASVAFSPDGKQLAWASWTGHVHVYDWPQAREIADFDVRSVARVAFSANGALLAAATENKTVQLWDVAQSECVADLPGDLLRFHCVTFSPDGQRVLAGGGDWKKGGVSQVTVWDVASKEQVLKLTGQDLAILCIAYSPDGRTVATGAVDNTICLWDAASGTLRHTLRGHTRWVESVAFTPDGKTLFSGSHDHTIRVWDVDQAREKGRLDLPGSVRSVRLTPDGTTLIAGGGQKTLRVFDTASHQDLGVLWGGPDPRRAPMEALPVADPEPPGTKGWLTAAAILVLVLAGAAVLVGRARRGRRTGPARLRPTAGPACSEAAASIPLVCPGCRKRLRVKPQQAGKKVKCPQCGQVVQLLGPAEDARQQIE